ncbi:hypothetical protein O7599_20330 [Streptomyces sp. WMMC500]|uniref:hypothetical protein n=1 Tax=Streptomyces sp. WMMC500 TaxID=3015154 RepID=UPI00248CE371|nr:hypothetical protein [Streptomyces sp. WMMC500]WBB58012.1 hypothetical protein O7599_20330 [Streptomyces sp. WMMC500]
MARIRPIGAPAGSVRPCGEMIAPAMAAPHASAGTELRLLRAAVFTAVCVVLSAGGHVLASNETVPLWSLGVSAALVFALAVPLAGRERSLPGIAALLAVGQTGLHGVFGFGQQCAVGGAAATGHGAHAGGASGAGGEGGGAAVELARRLLCNDAGMHLTEGRAREIVTDAGLDPDAGIGGAGGAAGTHAAHGGGAGDGLGTVFDLSTYSLPMILGHLLAALAAGWLLRRGDAALTTLLRIAAGDAALAPLRAAVRYVRALDAGFRGAGRPVARPRAVPAYDERSARTVRELQHTVVRRGPPALALAA